MYKNYNGQRIIIFNNLNRQIIEYDDLINFSINTLDKKFLSTDPERIYDYILMISKISLKEDILSDFWIIYNHVTNKHVYEIDNDFLIVSLHELTRKYGKFAVVVQYVYTVMCLLMNVQKSQNQRFAQDLTLYGVYKILYEYKTAYEMATCCLFDFKNQEEKELIMNSMESDIKRIKLKVKQIVDK